MLRDYFARARQMLLTTALLMLASCALPDPNVEPDEDGGFDECGGDRADGYLGDVCREDCDCAVGYSCLTDDYDEQCCAQDLNDLDNGVWGIDCDGVQ
jgi:hypothetical protein